MKHTLRTAALALGLALAASNTAVADNATTLGGLVIKSEDGNFVGSLGGRVQFDYTGISPDKSSRFDSGAAEDDSGFYFRRVFISLSGELYGFRYRIDEDISNTSTPASGFNDVYISHDLWNYGTIRVGQTKPWRSLDELTPNTDILFTNRNAVSAVGLLGGRDYQQGGFYRYYKERAFDSFDSAWAGFSVYSLNKAGASTDQGTGTPTQGLGYNLRLAYAPIETKKAWLHVGANYSSDHADNGGKLTSGSTDWYSYRGLSQNIVSIAGNQPAATPTTAQIVGGDNPSATTIIGELAGAYGPAYFQAEYGLAKFRQATRITATTPNEQTVDAFTVQGSYYLTGETKFYDPNIATTRSAKPLHKFGAIELAARYDFIKNRDLPAGNTAICKPTVGAIPKGSVIDKCDLSTITVGANYYLNPAVRFTVDYDLAKFDLGSAGQDKPNALNARVQLVF